MSFVPRTSSHASTLTPAPAPALTPGSFSSDARSQLNLSRAASRLDLSSTNLLRLEEHDGRPTEQMLGTLREALIRELKIKEGSENMLEALHTKKAKQTKDQRSKVEAELYSSNQRIKELKSQIADLQNSGGVTTPMSTRMASLFQGNELRSPDSVSKGAVYSEDEEPTESPTYVLAEILQALEVSGLTPDYYISHANDLIELFKRHPNLKHDLVWSVFGLRMQIMLLSDSREVVAAGYRMTRYAISDIASLHRIRSLHTDELVILSLIKERKADVEREQALKFVRAFLEIKDGVQEISRGIIRTVASIAEHTDDRLRPICIETLAEIMIKDPQLLIWAGGLRPLIDALGEGAYDASEGLISAFLYLLDSPQRRKYLRPGYGLEVLFTVFTDSLDNSDRVLHQKARAIVIALKSWSGLMTLSMYNFRAIRSLISSLMMPQSATQEVILDLLYALLRIKAPSWSSSFLAGRRLTTYGRVANLKSPSSSKETAAVTAGDHSWEEGLVDHYTALLLSVLVTSGLLPSLLYVTKVTENAMLKRKAILLTSEILKLSDKLLPSSWSNDLQFLPGLFAEASTFGTEERYGATGIVYQIDSVNRTLNRSTPAKVAARTKVRPDDANDRDQKFDESTKASTVSNLDETTFRQMLLDTQVLSSTVYSKWNWDVILKIIEGPLLNGKRLDEAIKASKFIKRVISFYRPFKYKFAEAQNTRLNQKYVRVGCALMHTLLQTTEGVRYLSDNKLLRQIAECLAQCDPTSGLTAQSPMFSQLRLSETLCCGYFQMLGVLSSDVRGLQMLDRWRMVNMMYHIIDLKERPDLTKLLLVNFNYSLQGHPQVLLSKALTAGTKDVRTFATNVLRKYLNRSRSQVHPGQDISDSKWAIQLLVTQLYDPEVDVCATAIQTLEEACTRKDYLEYIVECRPALDHLGEIGAPLLLRFLSTSLGYRYLDGLDYINNEMDDWFLGRNDAYVTLIEAVLARSFAEPQEEMVNRFSLDDDNALDVDGIDAEVRAPSHFYRELTRTEEGCKLLQEKGHFQEFATMIRDHGMQVQDQEMVLRLKGCLWAVGNVGSMELGAPFLESSDVVEHIIHIAERHDIMSVRGTAFFVLGMISRSSHGLEIVAEFGWDSNTSIMGDSTGLCLPQNLGQFFSFVPWKHEGTLVFPRDEKQDARDELVFIGDATANQRILELIVDLGNTVLTKRAMTELMHIKQKKPSGFRQPLFFRRVLSILECHHFRLLMRRFVIDLFDRNVLRRLVLDEDSDEEELASTDGSQAATERQMSISDD